MGGQWVGVEFFFFFVFHLVSILPFPENKDALDPVGPHLDATDPPGKHVEEHGDLERERGRER